MITRLRGEVVEVEPLHVVLDVGGVGYRVWMPSVSGVVLGSTVLLYTHLAVRENSHDLYGFTTREALTMFEHLIKLPKIGPKTALQILSQADLTTIRKAVQTNDPVYLSKMSGIGKKSAEKIVAGLTDILEGTEFVGDEGSRSTNERDSDILDALMTLGYSQRDALQAVQKIPADIIDTNARIKYALKAISS